MTTNRMTGIDIRRTLLDNGLNPNNYDEQAIFDANPQTVYAVLVHASEHPKETI